MQLFLPSFLKIPAIFFLFLCACVEGGPIKRMETFDTELFMKRYFKKEPVVISKTKPFFKDMLTDIFSTCRDHIFHLTRLPSMQEDRKQISLTEGFAPCGADCYGIYEAKVCYDIEENVDLPDAFWQEENTAWFSIAHKDIETPADVTVGHYFRYLSAGVEDWRILTRYEDGTIDLFVQQPYEDKLVAGELLYLPPNTLSQHKALTSLSMAVGSS